MKPLAATLLLAALSSTAHADCFIDQFLGTTLNPRWMASTHPAGSTSSWNVSSGRLNVTGFTGTSNPFVRFRLPAQVADGDFHWQSTVRWNDSTGPFYTGQIRVLDTEGAVIASVAMVDVWTNTSGTYQAYLDGMTTGPGMQGSVPAGGFARFAISRKDGWGIITIDDSIFLQGPFASEVGYVDLVAQNPGAASGPFGRISFSDAILEGESLTCAADINEDGQVNFDDLNDVLANWGGLCDQ